VIRSDSVSLAGASSRTIVPEFYSY
jgi:hypothetical protein